jgi:phosphomannomutase/phosphoglucomutase
MSAAGALNPAIFRAYDIRGIVGQGLDPTAVRLIGQAIGSELRERGGQRLFAARDARLSSPSLAAALVDGLCSSGVDVVDLGAVPTPLLYFATCIDDCGSGVMLTGSHNPRDYNGIKIVLNRSTLSASGIQQLRQRIEAGTLAQGAGRVSQRDIVPQYLERIGSDLRLQRRFKVVVDAGNGIGGPVALQLLQRLGCEVIPLYCEPDGRFPHHHPDPTRPENLRDLTAAVARHAADLGIALDGDADRLGLVTAAGRRIDADQLLLAFATDLLPGNPGGRVVFDVKSSFHLPRRVKALGGEPVMCKSGHSFVKRAVEESGALLGGEFSAHVFFGHRWYGFDDGLYAAARFLELLDKQGLGADDLLARLPSSSSTPELFVPVEESHKFALMQRLQADLHFADGTLNHLDGVRVDFADGWALVRASNTTPALVLRCEAESATALQRIVQRFGTALLAIEPGLRLPFDTACGGAVSLQ